MTDATSEIGELARDLQDEVEGRDDCPQRKLRKYWIEVAGTLYGLGWRLSCGHPEAHCPMCEGSVAACREAVQEAGRV